MDPLAQYNQAPGAVPQQPLSPVPPVQQPAYAPSASQAPLAAQPLNPQSPVGHQPTHHRQHPDELPSMEGVTALHKPWIAIFSVILLLIVGIGSFTIYVLNVRAVHQTEEAENRSKALTDKIAAEPLRSVEIQAKAVAAALSGYREARSDQLDLGLFNQQVRDIMPKNVVVDTVTMDDKGSVRVAVQSDTFIDSGKLLLAFRQSPLFSSAELETASLDKKEGQKPVTAVVIGTVNKSYLQTDKSSDDTQS